MPIDITRKTIVKAVADAKAGTVDITDTRGRGLILRGGPKGLTWQHRVQIDGKPRRLVLGTVDRWSIEEARQIAGAASDHAKSHGVAPDDIWLSGYLVSAGKIDASPVDDGAGSFPTFAEGRADYLAFVKNHRSVDTERSYRGFLEMPEVRALDERRLPTITRDEIVNIIIGVHGSGRESTSENLCRTLRPMLAFLGEDGRRLRYGVQPGLLVGIKPPPRTNVEPSEGDEDPWSDGYVPEIGELGRIIAIARSGIMSPTTAAAVELTCWTVQRRKAVAGARLVDLFDLGDGTGLWRIPASSRKGRGKKRPHTIPLPAPAWACVVRAAEAAIKKDPKTRYLFPAARPRRIGDPVTHMHPSTLTHLFLDLPYCGASPHDVRRTMATHGEDLLGLNRIDVGSIMDHAEGKKESERITSRTVGTGTDTVTGIHYALHDGTHRSWPVMRTWCDAIDRAIADEQSRLEPASQLARKFGQRNFRIGGPPAPMLMVVGVLDDAERIVAGLKPLRQPDDEDA